MSVGTGDYLTSSVSSRETTALEDGENVQSCSVQDQEELPDILKDSSRAASRTEDVSEKSVIEEMRNGNQKQNKYRSTSP